MKTEDIVLGVPTLCKMNAEIEDNKAAIAKLQNKQPSKSELIAKAVELGIDTDGLNKAELTEAIKDAK